MKWSDFRRCKWPSTTVENCDFVTRRPSNAEPSTDLCHLFAELNEPFIAKAISTREQRQNEGVAKVPLITFSHFLPRIECCPEKRFLSEQHLMKVIGSTPLDSQIRALQSDLHVVSIFEIYCSTILTNIADIVWSHSHSN